MGVQRHSSFVSTHHPSSPATWDALCPNPPHPTFHLKPGSLSLSVSPCLPSSLASSLPPLLRPSQSLLSSYLLKLLPSTFSPCPSFLPSFLPSSPHNLFSNPHIQHLVISSLFLINTIEKWGKEGLPPLKEGVIFHSTMSLLFHDRKWGRPSNRG